MGLDISAYSKLTKLDCVFDEYGDPIDPTTRKSIEYDARIYVNPNFPARCELSKGYYKAEHRLSFRAGGYGGYNVWRDELARISGYAPVQVDRYGTGRLETRYDHSAFNAGSGPFYELIWFSDCEGALGTEVSKKLAQDFADFQAKADAHHDSHFRERYAEWRKAFELAADGGAVCFH